MNFGTYDIEQVVWEQIRQCGGKFSSGISGGNKKFVKDLSKNMMKFWEEHAVNIDMRTELLARGGTLEDASMFDRICKAFSFDMMPLTDAARDVYRWVAEQERKGQRLETFVTWARSAERAQYINKYRKDAGNIKNDWALAFARSNTLGGEDERF